MTTFAENYGFSKIQLSFFGYIICGAAVVALAAFFLFKMLEVRRPEPPHHHGWTNLTSLVSRIGRQNEEPEPARQQGPSRWSSLTSLISRTGRQNEEPDQTTHDSANQVEHPPQPAMSITLKKTCPNCGKSASGVIEASRPSKSKNYFPRFVWAGATVCIGASVFSKIF